MPNNELSFEDDLDFGAGEEDFFSAILDADEQPTLRSSHARTRFSSEVDQSIGYPEELPAQEPASDPLDIDKESCRVEIRDAAQLHSNLLWERELYFGRAIRIHRDLVEEAIEAFPEHDLAIKRWWKVFQQSRSKCGFAPGSFASANKHSLLDDALKFNLFYESGLSSMSFQLGNRLFQVVSNHGEDNPPSLHCSRRRFSSMGQDVEMYISGSGSGSPFRASWAENHKGEIHAISAIISGNEMVAVGPLRVDAEVNSTKTKSAFQVAKVTLTGSKTTDHTLVGLMDPARRNGLVKTEEFTIEAGSPLYARFLEAAAFYGEGNRSIVQLGIVISDKYVSFIEPTHNLFSRQKLEMPCVSLVDFTRELNLIEAEGISRVERKLNAACRNFLGERPEEVLGVEDQAIVDALYELMRFEFVTNGVQQGWDQLSRRGIGVHNALWQIEEKWGITLNERLWPEDEDVAKAPEELVEAA
jgi:hypothetical protein